MIDLNLYWLSQDDDGSLNATNAAGAKQPDPSSLFTSEGLQASYRDLDKIFDNSDESNDTVAVDSIHCQNFVT